MAMLEIREALRRAMTEEMNKDESIFLMGKGCSVQWCHKVSKGMLEEFGENRIVDTPFPRVDLPHWGLAQQWSA